MLDIKGYENEYAITSCGKVWSYKSKKFLKPIVKRGYLSVNLYKDGKMSQVYIHKLVAEAYIQNNNNYETVDHIDRNRNHNYVNNLQWMTLKENVQKANGKKIQCIETQKVYNSGAEAAKEFGVNRTAITRAARLGAISCGFHWKYV